MRGRRGHSPFPLKTCIQNGAWNRCLLSGDVHIGSPDLDGLVAIGGGGRVFFSSSFANAQTKVFVLVTNINLGRRGKEKKN